MKDTTAKRFLYLDYLRLIASLAVVVLHVAAWKWESLDWRTFEWSTFNIYDSLVRWCVPIFVMISGALFLSKDIDIKTMWKKYISRIMAAFLFWSLLYTLYEYFVARSIHSFGAFVSTLFIGNFHMWFLYMLAGLYMITPFVRQIVKKNELVIYFVVLAFVFAMLLPEVIQILSLAKLGAANTLSEITGNLYVQMVMGYTGYYILGYYLHNHKLRRSLEIILIILGVLSILFTLFGTSYISALTNERNTALYGYLRVNVFFPAVALFTVMKNHAGKKAPSERKQSVWRYLSKCCFGVYLIHPMLLAVSEKCFKITTLSFHPAYSIPVISLCVFIVSLILSGLLNRIPIFNKWLI